MITVMVLAVDYQYDFNKINNKPKYKQNEKSKRNNSNYGNDFR